MFKPVASKRVFRALLIALRADEPNLVAASPLSEVINASILKSNKGVWHVYYVVLNYQI